MSVSLPNTPATHEPTSDWLTYENQEYGFSIKYPSNFDYQVAPGYPVSDWLFNMGFFEAQHKEKLFKPGTPDFATISLSVINNPKNLSARDFLQSNQQENDGEGSNSSLLRFTPLGNIETMTINKKDAVRFIDGTIGYKTPRVLVKHRSQILMFAVTGATFEPTIEQIFDQILPTMKFQP